MAPQRERINWQQVGVSDRVPTTMCGCVAPTGQASIGMRAFLQLPLNAVWWRMEKVPRLWGNPQLKETRKRHSNRAILFLGFHQLCLGSSNSLLAMCGEYRDFA